MYAEERLQLARIVPGVAGDDQMQSQSLPPETVAQLACVLRGGLEELKHLRRYLRRRRLGDLPIGASLVFLGVGCSFARSVWDLSGGRHHHPSRQFEPSMPESCFAE